MNYHASGVRPNRASCRCPIGCNSNPVTRTVPENPIILIPARLAASRLPGKPLAEIAGVPMIVHVWRRAVAAGIGPVVVACGDRAIADAVEAAGGRAAMTDPGYPTGSDRIHAAIAHLDPKRAFGGVLDNAEQRLAYYRSIIEAAEAEAAPVRDPSPTPCPLSGLLWKRTCP